MWFTMRELGVILFIFALSYNIQGQTINSDICNLPLDKGTESGSESEATTLMHYDAQKDACYPFRYTGKGGNANRFLIERQCMRNCSKRGEKLFPTDERQGCYLPKLVGSCASNYRRYYYSPEDKECKSFLWSGCEGNGNRFLSMSWCNATCHNADENSGDSGVPVGIIVGVVFGLIGAVIIIVVIVIAVKKKKPSSKKRGKKEKGKGKGKEKSAEQPLKELAIEMGGGEAQPAAREAS
ncbi:Kunitz-type U19-barytoxin-Tl1a [Labeo rohita]|uniref:Kunitz-type U19-barytoxin-Tl1a n=1 Tax=Labeo rohita TaxID=84645 RepID=A0ABQ8LC14_LABRO|nr:BPTI/Kunitz domain-containing protein [Labeo rohita]KAI2648277.1 Kunitz-type U19-barytoxin-Tl1a [Labeo rohita]